MSDRDDTYQRLGEAVLEEIVVRAGLEQAQAEPRESVSVALTFIVSAEAEENRLVIRGDRVGQTPLELRIQLG